jgi:predicted ester cyclase
VTEGGAAVARRYFDAIAARDLDTAAACWVPGGVDHLAPVGELRVPDEWRAYFSALFAAAPDFRYEVVDVLEDGDRAAVRWRAGGTFARGEFQGIVANGARVESEGLDLVRTTNGLIERIDSYWDDAAVARSIGVLPPRGSRAERALLGLFNIRTRVARALRRR